MKNEESSAGALRTIDIAGTPAAMGEAYGEQFREEIRTFSLARLDSLLAHVRKYDPEREVSREDVLALAGRTVEAHKRFDPPIWEEFCGIARAAGLRVEELLIGNGLTDFRDYVLFQNPALSARPPAHLGECTAFLAPGACADGHPIIGQTWDMNAHARRFLVVVHRKPSDAPETLGLTTVGCLCLIGLSSEGVAVGNTNLVPIDAGVGVNYLFTLTRALRCASAEEAAEAVEATPRLSGHNFYVADERAAINVETAATRSRRTVVEREVFVHANHYLDESLRPLEFAGQDLGNSRSRHTRLAGNFRTAQTPLAMDDCWEQLSDITQGDEAIGDEGYDGVATCATVVQCAKTRTLFVCAGGPRAGNQQVLTL